ncbi:MAG: hypothetical protein JXQ87_13235 [Bacteroidia bacterium]
MQYLITIFILFISNYISAQHLVSIDDRINFIDSNNSVLLNQKLNDFDILYTKEVNFKNKCLYKFMKIYKEGDSLVATMQNCNNELLALNVLDFDWKSLKNEEVVFLISRFIKHNIDNEVPIDEIQQFNNVKPYSRVYPVDASLKNHHSTRYFFGPSSFGMKKGEFYYQTTWGVLHDLQYGITDHFSIGFGAPILPLVGYVTPKFSWSLRDKLSFAIGSINGLSIVGGVGSVYYSTITFGNEENNLTLGAGFATSFGNGTPLINISGIKMLSPNIYAFTENYITPQYTEVFGFSGLRAVLRRNDVNCINAGIAYFPTAFDWADLGFVPLLPMLSYAHKFGARI